MTMIRSMASYYRRNLQHAARHRFQYRDISTPQPPGASTLHPAAKPEMKTGSTNPSLPIPPTLPPRFSLFTWAKWAVGAILTIMLPIWNQKWRSILRLESEVEMVAEAVENAAVVVEKVATVTEKMAADAAESMPEDGRLKDAALFVEKVSEEVAKDAHLTQDIIRKVDELKEEVEMLIDPKESKKQP